MKLLICGELKRFETMGNTAGRHIPSGSISESGANESSSTVTTPASQTRNIEEIPKEKKKMAFVDPRSPTKGVCRTPVEERRGSGAAMRGKGKNQGPRPLRRTEHLLFSEIVDPRSPTIPRSPVVLANGHQLVVPLVGVPLREGPLVWQ